MGADAWVVQVLHFGYQVPFRSLPPLSLLLRCPCRAQPLFHPWAGSDLLAKEVIELAPPSPGFYSRLFVTPKVTGGWRPVIDLSRLNSFVDVSHFHMETAQTVLQSLREGDWLVSLDLQDAYLQGESVYQFCALCFGLSTSLQVFTRVMAPVSTIMHRHGFRILRYLDDWLVLASTFQESVRARDFLLWLCQRLGIRVNLPKSSLTPLQTQDYLGITIQTIPLRVFPTLKRIQKLSLLLQDFLSTRSHPVSVWRQLLGIMSSMSALVPGSCLRIRSLQIPLNVGGRLQQDDFLVEWDSACHKDLLWWSNVSHLTVGESLPDLCLFTDASDTGWGASLGDVHLRLVVFPFLSVFHQSPGASGGFISSAGFPSLSSGTCSGGVLRQHHRLGVPQETGGYSLRHFQHHGSVGDLVLRGVSHPTSSAVHPRQDECPRRLSESQGPGHRFQVDPLCRGVSPAASPLTCHHRPLCDLPQSQVAGLLLSDVGPSVSGHRRHAPELGWPSGLLFSSFRPPFSSPGESPTVQGVGVDVDRPVLATTSVVPGPSRASGGDSLLPATKEGSSQPAPLPSLSPEPPRASADCLAYLQRSTHHSGFSSAVARQFTLCRRRSTRVSYQAKWAVYRAWCHRHGHSVSRPSVAKVADFLLYLRRSLSLSYSSIASYRSMLSGVFRFILPELSSHFVLHDLLRSFRLERPLPASRVPPWDLLLVLCFL